MALASIKVNCHKLAAVLQLTCKQKNWALKLLNTCCKKKYKNFISKTWESLSVSCKY